MQIIKGKNLNWVDIKGPDKADLNWLKENFELHPLVLKELLPPLDHPKLANFGDYLFIVLFYPFFDRKTFSTLPLELDIIVSKKYIITNHYKDIVPLKAIFDKCNLYEEEREEYMENSAYLLYKIINEILNACFPKLGHIKKNIDEVEKKIYQAQYKKAVHQISLIKRDIIGFKQTIELQKLLLKSLISRVDEIFGEKFVPYFNNLFGTHQRINSILLTYHKTLDALDSTNQSLLSTRTNEIIKLLTIFSVIVFPLTLLAAIFGMNTEYLPLVGGKGDFWVILGIMLMATASMLIFFKKKKWL